MNDDEKNMGLKGGSIGNISRNNLGTNWEQTKNKNPPSLPPPLPPSVGVNAIFLM
jgi:hypothetical protein